jgi:hypothetical protein
MVEKISTENRFSEDKDKPFAGACAATEWKIPSTKTISARANSISEITYSSRAALKDELVYQLSSRIRMNWPTLEISHKYHERAKSVLYRINLYNLSAIDVRGAAQSKGIFVINTHDLLPPLRNKLEQLKRSDPRGFDQLVTEAIQTLLEGINERYYHIAGLPYRVTWRFEP